MPSTIQSYAEFAALLAKATAGMDAIVESYPNESVLRSIRDQLVRLAEWTRGGRVPTLQERGELNFGLLASRDLHDIDGSLASLIYEIASFVTYRQLPRH